MSSIVNYTSDSSEEETRLRYDTPICGPKSWKEKQDDESYNEELAQIFESSDGGIQEAFGRIYDLPNKIFENSHFNVIEDEPTITIPNIGPGMPIQCFNGSYMFSKNDQKNIKYASCGNIARSVAEANEEDKCAICNEGFCQEMAGDKWYELTNWKRAHMSCWKLLCLQYHLALKEEKLNNTLQNWILFLSNSDLL